MEFTRFPSLTRCPKHYCNADKFGSAPKLEVSFQGQLVSLLCVSSDKEHYHGRESMWNKAVYLMETSKLKERWGQHLNTPFRYRNLHPPSFQLSPIS